MYEIVIPLPKGIDDRLTDRVKARAAKEFGGFTTTDAQGGWVAPNGETVTEPVTVLTVVADRTDPTDGPTAETWAKVTARHVSEESDETTVMWFVRQITAGGFE